MTRDEILRLALEVGCSQRTVERWGEDPESVSPTTRWALGKALADMRARASTEPPAAQ